MKNRVIRLPSKRLVEEYNKQGEEKGYSAYPEGLKLRGFVDREAGVVYLEKGATKTREQHELWHLDHPHGELGPQALVDNEIKAELYAWKKIGRKPDVRVGIPATAALLADYSEKYTPDKASSLVVKRLKHFGFDTSKEHRGWLSRRFGGEG